MLTGRKPHSKPLARAALTVASFVLAVFVCLGLGHAVHAQGVTSNELLPGQFGNAIGLTTTDIRVTIANIIRIALGLLGTIALLIVLYAGFIWMTAGGEEEKVSRAKKMLTSAVIGLVIILTAFAIVSFVISRLLGATNGNGPGSGAGGGLDDNLCIGLSATCPAGALGNGVIESHYPARSATGVPRNTRIAITFKKKIDPASLVVGPTGTIAVIKSTQIATNPGFKDKFAQSLTAADIDVVPAGDGKTFVLMQKKCPTDCFGSPTENVWYTVALQGGGDGVKLEGGNAAFTGTFSSGYLWDFQISTVLDLTPPHVTYVEPGDAETDVVRNTIIQVNFDEAVDPVSLVQGLSVADGGTVVKGIQMFGNAYRTLEFRTNEVCGTNSCGEQVYCLPANKTVAVTVRSDGLTTTPPLGIYPPNGVTDMCGNSLDGDEDGIAQGPTKDDYPFSFKTNDQIDLTPPTVLSQDPNILQGGIPRDAAIDATFSKRMSATSFTTDAMRLVPGGNPPTNFSVTSDRVMSTAGVELDQTKATIKHDLLPVNSPKYSADMNSGLRDLHQNCFYPGGAAGGGGGSTCTDPSKPFCCNGKPYATAAEATAFCGFAP